ncbi:D-3-phosphoglycerate dehydrogenase [compost metagenome]
MTPSTPASRPERLAKVLVLDRVDPAAIPLLDAVAEVDDRDAIAPDELLAIIGDYDALMVRSATKVTREVIAAGRRLRIIGRAGVGVDNIDVPAATQAGIIVVNSPEGNTIAASEHALALMLALARRVPPADASMKAGLWQREAFMGSELYQKVLGVMGLGKIGARLVKAANALGMRVLAYDPFVTPERASEMGAELMGLDELLASSDYLSIHVPKTPETSGLFDRETLAKCKRGIRIVNAARGGIIDEDALAEAIREGQVAGAALDVFAHEPLPELSPLRSLGDRIILTPHLGASTEEAQIKVAVDVAEQIVCVLTGEPARSAVNIPSMRPELIEPVKAYLPLAEKLGSLVAQIMHGPARRIEVLYQGGLAGKAVEPLTTAVLKGILSQAVPEGVNYVNASLVAKERGLEVREARSSEAKDYADLITVTLAGDGLQHTVAGTLLSESGPGGGPRLVKIDDFAFNLMPQGYVLLIPHQDMPGAVGHVGTLLGQANINIFGLQLGRQYKNGPAMMVLNVDDAVPAEMLAALGKLPGFRDVSCVHLA